MLLIVSTGITFPTKELAGGTISSEIKDVFTTPAPDFIVDLAYEKVHSLVGKAASFKQYITLF